MCAASTEGKGRGQFLKILFELEKRKEGNSRRFYKSERRGSRAAAARGSVPRPQLRGGGVRVDEAVPVGAAQVTLRLGSLARLRNGNSPARQRCCENGGGERRPAGRNGLGSAHPRVRAHVGWPCCVAAGAITVCLCTHVSDCPGLPSYQE